MCAATTIVPPCVFCVLINSLLATDERFCFFLKRKFVSIRVFSVFLFRENSLVMEWPRRRCRVKYNSRSKFLTHTPTPARKSIERGSLGVRQRNFRTHRRNSNARDAVRAVCPPSLAYRATFPHFLLPFVFTAYLSGNTNKIQLSPRVTIVTCSSVHTARRNARNINQ